MTAPTPNPADIDPGTTSDTGGPPPPPEQQAPPATPTGRRRAAEDQEAGDVTDDQAGAGRPKRGDYVNYRHPDPITGGVLEGYGVVLVSPEEGALIVAPLSPLFLEVEPANVVLVSLDEELGDDSTED